MRRAIAELSRMVRRKSALLERLQMIDKTFRRKISSLLWPHVLLLFLIGATFASDQNPADFGVVSPERQRSCAKAFNDLPSSFRDSIIDLTDRDEISRSAPYLQAYDEFCLERWEGLRPKTREVLKDIAGFFFLEQSGSTDLICAGFRISEKYVVTAAHCLWWRGAQIDPTRLTFRLLSAPQLDFRPTALENSRDLDDERLLSDREDFAVLRIETHSIPLSPPATFFREQLPFTEYLLIPGVNLYDYWLRNANVSGDWLKSVRVNKGRSCFRHQVDNLERDVSARCVFDICQTLEAMSGAAIFGYDHTRQMVYVGGIHLRAGLLGNDPVVRSHRECGQQESFNVGITLPKEIVDLAAQPGK